MKKILVVGLISLMMITAVGCSKNETPSKGENENIVSEENNSIKNIYFGKIKKIVGNEVEINIAKESILEPGDGEDGMGSSSEATVGGPIEDLNASMSISTSESSDSTVTEAGTGGPGTEMKQEIIDESKNKLELEYTGENKNMNIPAGATVLDLMTGRNIKISDIKDGDVIRAYTKAVGDKEVIFHVEVVK